MEFITNANAAHYPEIVTWPQLDIVVTTKQLSA